MEDELALNESNASSLI